MGIYQKPSSIYIEGINKFWIQKCSKKLKKALNDLNEMIRQLNQGDYDELYLIRCAEFLYTINKSYEKETTKIPKKMPVNFLTDWHYPIQGAFDNLYFKQLRFGDPKDS